MVFGFTIVFLNAIDSIKSVTFQSQFQPGKRKKSYGARLEEYERWLSTAIPFLVRNVLTLIAVWANVLSCKSHQPECSKSVISMDLTNSLFTFSSLPIILRVNSWSLVSKLLTLSTNLEIIFSHSLWGSSSSSSLPSWKFLNHQNVCAEDRASSP